MQWVNRPLLWAGGAGVVLLAVAVVQYSRHPEWLGPFHRADVGPSGSQRGDLTAEEAASLADIDTLSLLQDQIPDSAAGSEATGSLTPEASSLLSLEDLLTSGGSISDPTTSPFADYLDQVRFDRPASANPVIPETAAGGTTVDNPFLRDAPFSTAAPTREPSALQSALDQQFNPPSTSSPGQPQSQATATDPVPSPSTAEDEVPSSAAPTPFSPGLVQSTLPVSGQTFIRTSPQMSPPPGTTGYTVPSGLSPLPSVSTPPLPIGSPVVPDLSPDGLRGPSPSPGNFSSSANGLGLPPNTPTDGAAAPPGVAPFTVPRPPGSYTGGGYIYTFSNPNGPPP